MNPNDPWNPPHYIYAYVSPSDEVVYVGRTWDPGTRHGAHRQRSPWWTPDLTFALVDECWNYRLSQQLEAEAIEALEPLANVHHNRRRIA